MKLGLTQQGALLHLPPAKHIVYFHLARMGRGQGEVLLSAGAWGRDLAVLAVCGAAMLMVTGFGDE